MSGQIIDVDALLEEAGSLHLLQWCYLLLVGGLPWVLAGMMTMVHLFVALPPAVDIECPVDELLPMINASHSLVQEWKLVCGKESMADLLESGFMFGMLVGAGFLGGLADKYGRIPVLYFSCVGALVAGLGSALAQSYTLYALTRIVTGFFIAGLGLVAYVLCSEFLSGTGRAIQSVVGPVMFATGVALLSQIAYRRQDDWRNVQMTVFLSGVMLLPLLFVKESPRWLAAQGHKDKALDVLQYIARVNSRPFSLSASDLPEQQPPPPNPAQKELAANPYAELWVLKVRMIGQMLLWFACSFGYYGMSLSVGGLGGDVYTSSLMSSLMEFPANLAAAVACQLPALGRKQSTVVGCFLSGGFCVAAAFIPQPGVVFAAAFAGKFFCTGAFAIAFLYGGELFPTPSRSTALGLQSLSARLGGILSPLVPAGAVGMFIFSVPLFVAAFAVSRLPETLGRAMPESLEEVGDLSNEQLPSCFRSYSQLGGDAEGEVEMSQSFNEPPGRRRSWGSPRGSSQESGRDWGGSIQTPDDAELQ